MLRSRTPTTRVGGFTLLEMMIAMGILAISLTWLVEATSRAISAENHAKLVSTAGFLARGRLVELEDELLEKGFTDDSFSKETSGDFEDRGFKRFRWTTIIDKVELPSQDQVQSMATAAADKAKAGAGDPASPLSQIPGAGLLNAGSNGVQGGSGGPLGAGMGLLQSQFGLIKDVLEQGIRKARVTVAWVENGREQRVELVEYLTDPKRVDMAIPGLGMLNALQSANGGSGANAQPANSNGPPTNPPLNPFQQPIK